MWFGGYFIGVWLSFKHSFFIPSVFRLHIYNFWSCLPVSGFVLDCFINLGSSLRHFCCHSGTVRVLNCESLWIKDVNFFQISRWQKPQEARGYAWRVRTSPPHGFGFVPQHRVGHTLYQAQSTPERHYNPETPLQATGPPLFPPFSGGSNFASVADFRTTLPLFCGWPGVSSRLPNPPPPPLERNKHAHTLVYSSSSCQRSCAGRSHALQLFWIIVLSSRPCLPLMECECKACSVSWAGIRCRVTVLGQVSGTGP